MNIVVIGGGPAAVFAAISARRQAPDAAVTLLTDEADEPYEKPPLSKAVLLGQAQPADAPIAGPGGLAAQGITLQTRAACLSIDRGARHVVLHDRRRIPYDALVIATGALVREIPDLPPGTPGVYYLRTAGDAAALKAALSSCRHLLVVGAGLIGLEVAASAAALGVRTTVLEAAPRIMARVCYEDVADIVHQAHCRHGVDIRLNATLASKEEYDADAIVVGVGATPNTALARAAGLTVDDGIVVDGYCRTSDPAIFAAGDCARFPGPAGLVRLENWRHAQDHGVVAGRNAAGAGEAYRAIPSFWSEQYDLYIQGVGWPVAGAARVRRPLPAPATLVFDLHEGRLVYAMGINVQKDLAAARRLMERNVPVDRDALADPAQPLAALLKTR